MQINERITVIKKDAIKLECCDVVLCKKCWIYSARRYSECSFCPSETIDADIFNTPPRTCSVHEKICMHCDRKMSVEEFQNHKKCVKDLAVNYRMVVEKNKALEEKLFLKTMEFESQKLMTKRKDAELQKLKKELSDKDSKITLQAC